MRITEVSVPSSWPSPELGLDFGWWHGPWDLERQAEWVELFYTLCYSVPEVSEITWWNATDEGAFIKDGGLMFADYLQACCGDVGAPHQWLERGRHRASGQQGPFKGYRTGGRVRDHSKARRRDRS